MPLAEEDAGYESDAVYRMLEVVPRLPPRARRSRARQLFPYNYMSTLRITVLFASESALLHALVINNQRYERALLRSILHHERLKEAQSHFPGAVCLAVR
jgi:hypothetical protein